MVGGKSLGERTFNLSTIIIMVILMAVTIYPFWFSLISSLNSGEDLLRGPIFLWPREWTWASWEKVLIDPGILQAAWITASRTIIVTVVSMLYTSMFAYAFSRSYLKGKQFYVVIGFASMYFSGGLIPSFMLMNWLGLYDHYLVYILPSILEASITSSSLMRITRASRTLYLSRRRWMEPVSSESFSGLSYRYRNRSWQHCPYLQQ